MHLRAVVLLVLPTLLLSQEESTPQSGDQLVETVQPRMASPDVPSDSGLWSRCGGERRLNTEVQRQEPEHPEPPHQRAAESDSYQTERQAFEAESHHNEEQQPYHANYGGLAYQGAVPNFGYMGHPRRGYYDPAAINYPYQPTGAQYHYAVPNY